MTRYAQAHVVLLLSIAFTSAFSYAADINVLVIGSEKSSSDSRLLNGKVAAFSAAGVTEELQKIIGGAGLGTAHVVMEERFQHHGPYASFNLASWFYWPFPEEVETKTRWPNLRGENGTTWDYVVLIGDPYTIEYLPGLYTHGVAKIAEEVAKGKAKTVLLMPWPAAGSASSVAHYKEVVYRTGRSGGLLVAPAALAWEAAGKPQGETHPSKDGAYLAAASIYSLIWKKSATTSSYKVSEKLADTAHLAVTANGPHGEKPYTGAFKFQQPFAFYGFSDRSANPGKSPGGSSTEQYLTEATQAAIERAGASIGGRGFRIGRDSGGPQNGKDYRIGDVKFEKTTFAYRYQTNIGNPDVHLAEIFVQDIDLADQVQKESNNYRSIPRRLLFAGLHQLNPGIKPMSSHGHLSSEAHTACGTFIFTIISGRCPVDPKPNPVTNEWLSQMEGYQTAWRMATCHVRAPGFKVMPAGVAADSKKGDYLTVQFLLPPLHPVTVQVSCPSDVANVSEKTLTFTPQNYNQPQRVLVKAIEGAKPGTAFDVRFQTVSLDEVYDSLSDSWTYQVNNPPVAAPQEVTVSPGVPIAMRLTGSDANGQAITFALVNQPKLGVVTVDGSKVVYTANPDAVGTDSYSFKANDSLEDSEIADVKIIIKAKSLYDFNLLENATADLGVRGWNTVAKTDGMSAREGGTNGVAYFRGDGESTAELYQDVDLRAYAADIGRGKQAFRFVGHRLDEQETHFIVEYMDNDRKVLERYDSGDIQREGKRSKGWEKTEKELLAPVNTASVRIRMISRKTEGRSNSGSFDELSLVAIKPN